MTRNPRHLKELLQKPANTQQKPVLLKPGQVAVIFNNAAALDMMQTALIEADAWTGYNYTDQVTENSTIIKN